MFLDLNEIGFYDLSKTCNLAIEYLINKVDQAEIRLAIYEEINVSARLNDIEHLASSCGKSIIIKVYKNGSLGVASTTSADYKSILHACDKACSIAEYTNKDIYMQ